MAEKSEYSKETAEVLRVMAIDRGLEWSGKTKAGLVRVLSLDDKARVKKESALKSIEVPAEAIGESKKPSAPPPKAAPPAPPVQSYRVTEDSYFRTRGGNHKLAKNSIVTEITHDLQVLRSQGVRLEETAAF